jgi:DNA repair protein RadC
MSDLLNDILDDEAPAPSTKEKSKADEPHYAGHRARLRARFLEDPKGLQDYELLELVLALAIPRRDVKPLAKELLTEFGDLWKLVRAPSDRLSAAGLTDGVMVALQSIGELAERGLKAQVVNRTVITHWEDLLSYCRAAMSAEREEQFRLLYLDNKNKLMKDEVLHRGTVNHTPAYPREIIKRALDLGASAVILVHNHPSGDPTPSQADIKLTKDIVRAAEPLGIKIHDHLIIAGSEHCSLKALGVF